MVELTQRVRPQRLDRLDRLAENGPQPIRVELVREELRGYLRHPNGVKFRERGSIEWPNDVFTQRRIRDGDIREAEDQRDGKAPQPSAPQAPQPSAPQEHAASSSPSPAPAPVQEEQPRVNLAPRRERRHPAAAEQPAAGQTET
jgi:hypothetical protein